MPTFTREPFHPAYNGEFKSAMSSGDGAELKMMDELLTYCMLGMVGSYFGGVPSGCHRFFSTPPYAFGLAAFPHVGYLLAVERVGKLLATVVSQPFFLGSPEHAAAVARLPDRDFSADAYDLPVEGVGVCSFPDDAPGSKRKEQPRLMVIWRTEPPPAGALVGVGTAGRRAAPQHAFFKLLRCEGFKAEFFRNVHAVYTRLAAAMLDRSDPPPAAVTDAQLLYGAGELCVLMPWVHGRDATPADLAPGGCAVVPIAEAIAWLGRHGLLYVDVRDLNVRVAAGAEEASTAVAETAAMTAPPSAAPPRVSLLDYDDMVVVDPPPATADELLVALGEHHAVFVQPEGVPGARPALVEALRAAWSRGAAGSSAVGSGS